jgi:hypothetical protein
MNTPRNLYKKIVAENEKMRGIIARNTLQRLRGEDATKLYVTADDIKESLEILYAWQSDNNVEAMNTTRAIPK